MNKSLLITSLATVLVLAPAAQAGHQGRPDGPPVFYDTAEVIEAEPITRTVRVSEPARECWEEEVRRPVRHVHGGDPGKVVMGGVIGGVIGHQIGKGSGNRAATLAGTLIGASMGHRAAMRDARVEEYDEVDVVTRCRVDHSYRTEERVDGYRVTYRYRSETFTTRMPYDPGTQLRVRVKVAPVRN